MSHPPHNLIQQLLNSYDEREHVSSILNAKAPCVAESMAARVFMIDVKVRHERAMLNVVHKFTKSHPCRVDGVVDANISGPVYRKIRSATLRRPDRSFLARSLDIQYADTSSSGWTSAVNAPSHVSDGPNEKS